jgi:hypothetical protein
MKSGELTVTGNNSAHILLDKHPHEVIVRFVDIEHVPCDHPHHDHLQYEIETIGEDPKHHHDPGHHHHDRQFYLFIKWEVVGVREIIWHVRY